MRVHPRKFFVNIAKLLTAFSFFRLRSHDLRYFQYVFPTFAASVILLGYHLLSGEILVIKLDAFVSSATTLMGVLIGFYIAALAAVTSFPSESLNNIMSGDAPKMKERWGGQDVALTRRRFLAILLGYCAFLSIFIFILGSVSAAVNFGSDIPTVVKQLAMGAWWFVYTWFLSSLLIVTMLCLHYLIERMHRD
ncbi:hypothetical protein [Sulfitobacter pontiacus]|uniref:hypothetical protein n=1 Tax=Sulfitobacter pontiacus TaxID=60137 RepID=UPI0030EC40CB